MSKEKEKKTKMDLLYEAVEDVTFFVDKNDRESLYAEFDNYAGKREFASLNSEAFKSFLFMQLDAISEDDVGLSPTAAVDRLRLILSHEKSYQPTEIFVRTAGDLMDSIEYDLQNSDQETVKVTPKGWEVSAKKRKFVRSSVNLGQVKPIRTKKTPLELLQPLVNLAGNSFVMFVVWLVQAFSTGNHHAMLVFAERGSGKSTISKLVKQLVDPCKFSVIALPTKADDLHTLLYNTALVCFDNVSSISHETSDIFCGAITGTAITKRSLYTNNDLNVVTLHNTILLNGIGVVPERDDLAERMLILKLEKLKKDEIELEHDIWDEFERTLPEILGSIFNTLSAAMRLVGTINIQELPRMADSYVEMAAIALALGIQQDEFRAIYDANKAELEQARVGTPLVTAVKECMETVTGRCLQGTATEVYQKVVAAYSGDKKLLPQSASHLTRKLESEYGNLAKAGFRVNIDDTGSKSTEIRILKKRK